MGVISWEGPTGGGQGLRSEGGDDGGHVDTEVTFGLTHVS